MKLAIFLHSGAYDRVHQALAISTVVLATGGEVNAFCSYGALKRLRKGNTDSIVIEGEQANFEAEFRKNVERKTIDTISEMILTARKFGRFKLYACTASMAVLNIARDELIESVDSSMGLVSFLDIVKGSDKALYI